MIQTRRLVFSAVLAAAPALAAAQSRDIRVVGSSHISVGESKRSHYECYLAVDPGDPRHIITTSMYEREKASPGETLRMSSDMYVTFDGGKRWERARLGKMDSTLRNGITGAGDPSVIFGKDRTPYLALYGTLKGRGRVFLSRSHDGGRTWEAPFPTGNADRAFMAIDTTRLSPFAGTMYIAGQVGQIVISASLDSGRTWPRRTFLTDMEDDDGKPVHRPRGIAADILLGPEGEIAVPVSTTQIDWIARKEPELRGNDSIYSRTIDLIYSDNGGRTWRVRPGPVQVAVSGRRGDEAMGPPRAIVDLSAGPHRGRAFITYVSYNEGTDRQEIHLARSDDFGKTWAVTVVSDTVMRGPPANPTIALNKDGVVVLVWYDRRDDPNHHCWKLYGAVSTDGGATFRANQAISERPSCLSAPASWVPFGGAMGADEKHPLPRIEISAHVRENGGETMSILPDSTGAFHIGWISAESGPAQIWYTKIMLSQSLTDSLRALKASPAVVNATPGADGRLDVSQKLHINTQGPTFDFSRSIVSIPVRISNPTKVSFSGPVELELAEIPASSGNLGLKNIHARGENGKTGTGAAWKFVIKKGRLAGGESTEWRTIEFTFDPVDPNRSLDISDSFAPSFRIFARPAK